MDWDPGLRLGQGLGPNGLTWDPGLGLGLRKGGYGDPIFSSSIFQILGLKQCCIPKVSLLDASKVS